MADEIWLLRHGETEWTLTGQHTGSTDIPLTENGRKQAEMLKPKLADKKFKLVLRSPMKRSEETCRLAGWADHAQVDPDIVEWQYGEYEGKSTPQIRKETNNPEWTIWDHPPQKGESLQQLSDRADRVVEKISKVDGDVAIFSHGHFLRLITMRWLKFPAITGRLFILETGTVTVLTTQRGYNVLRKWNA